MGFLDVLGNLLTYNQYKDHIAKYKEHGLKQFVSNYKAHFQKQLPIETLKWGEEMEYQIFVKSIDENGNIRMQLASKGPELIKNFNSSGLSQDHGFLLMPEFGSWMIEAVPLEPYESLIDS